MNWLRAALGLLLLTAWPAAFSTTTQLNTTVSTISQLVSVNADLAFPPLVPGAQYAQTVNVSWALPADSLQNLTSNSVTVHVVAYTAADSWLALQAPSGLYRVYAFDLTCHVLSGQCAPDSRLSQSFQAVLSVPDNASVSGHSESLWVQASLSDSYQSISADSNAGFSQAVQNFIKGLPVGSAAQTLQRLFLFQNASANASVGQNASVAPASASGTASNPDANASSPAPSANQTAPTGLLSSLGLGDGSQNISPIAGLTVSKDDAVLVGGIVVLAMVAFLALRHFSDGKSNGVFEA